MILKQITNMGLNNIAELTVKYVGKLALLYPVLRVIDCAANYYMADKMK